VNSRASDRRVVTFGKQPADTPHHYHPAQVAYDTQGRVAFDVLCGHQTLARVQLPFAGEHNMMNALAAFAVGMALGLSPAVIAEGLRQARGVARRYEYKGDYNGAGIIDDYAHHPTEVAACLASARRGHTGRILCAFQPHLFSRTRDLLPEFARCFSDADVVITLPIYPAREAFDPTITSGMLAQAVREVGHPGQVHDFASFEDGAAWLRTHLSTGDLLLTVGAGDVYQVGEALLRT